MKIVHKYGGTSVADDACLRRVVEKIREDQKRGDLLVVVSAQGKTTDRLTERYRAWNVPFPSRESDALLVTGELQSAALLSAALQSVGLNAVSLNAYQVPILAYGKSGDGRICGIRTDRIKAAWKRGQIVVVPGFQGVTKTGEWITLGRGGSDTSAVALAAALKADVCRIFTDVDGVYSADPRVVPEAVRFPTLSFDRMLDLALAGAKVLHPRAAAMARRYRVPVEVASSFHSLPGTQVRNDAPCHSGIAVRKAGENTEISVFFSASPAASFLAAFQAETKAAGAYFPERLLFRITVADKDAETMQRVFHRLLYP